MKTVLFLCTGNYYRSRYAEVLFDWHAQRRRLTWRADSRGLELDPYNSGPMARATMAALDRAGISYAPYLRLPLALTDADLQSAHHIVAVKEAEHRPLLERKFAAWLPAIEFWHVHDLDGCGPEEALPQLEREVDRLLDRLAARPGQA
jgi:protein-tyrosine phosphatase